MMYRGEDKTWHCTVCGKASTLKTDVRRHVEAMHIEDHPGLSCEICGVVVKSRHALMRHKSAKHKYDNKYLN